MANSPDDDGPRTKRDRWTTREATVADEITLHDLIVQSATELQRESYSPSQIEAAIGPVFGVDAQMIEDKTYFVVERDGRIIGCGGWSFREALFGGRPANGTKSRCLDPAIEAARVRAFFVDPAFARQGVGSTIMKECEAAITAHGFRRGEISATLVGEPLYQKFGYKTTNYYEIALEGVPPLVVARMVKDYEV